MVVHVQRQNRCPRSCTPKLPTLLRETPCTEPSALVLLIQPDVHTYPLQCRDLAVQCAPPQHVCAGVEIAHHVLGGRCPVTPRIRVVGAAGSSPRPHLAWHQARRSYRSSIERTARTAACRRVCRGGARSAFALCPCSTPPATAMSSKRGATAMPAVLPLRNHAQASATLTRGIRVILTARRGGADSTQGLHLAQVRAQHQSGC